MWVKYAETETRIVSQPEPNPFFLLYFAAQIWPDSVALHKMGISLTCRCVFKGASIYIHFAQSDSDGISEKEFVSRAMVQTSCIQST